MPARTPARTTRALVATMAVLVAVVLAVLVVRSNQDATPAAAATSGAPPGATSRQPPRGAAPPGLGAEVTGSTLTRLSEVATARVEGTVEHAVRLPDGSYVVHVIASNGGGEVHVLVSRAFKVTGTRTGGPGGGPPAASAASPS